MREKCVAQEHNAVPRPRLEPGPLDPESSALTVRSQLLAKNYPVLDKKKNKKTRKHDETHEKIFQHYLLFFQSFLVLQF